MKLQIFYISFVCFCLIGFVASCPNSESVFQTTMKLSDETKEVENKTNNQKLSSERKQMLIKQLKYNYRSYNVEDSANWPVSSNLFFNEIERATKVDTGMRPQFEEIFTTYQKARLEIIRMNLPEKNFVEQSLRNYRLFMSNLSVVLDSVQIAAWLKENRLNYRMYIGQRNMLNGIYPGVPLDSTKSLFFQIKYKEFRSGLSPFSEREVEYMLRSWSTFYMVPHARKPKYQSYFARQLYEEICVACPWRSFDEADLTIPFYKYLNVRNETENKNKTSYENGLALEKSLAMFRNEMKGKLNTEEYLLWSDLHYRNIREKRNQYKQWEHSKQSQEK